MSILITNDKHSVIAAKGILTSVMATALLGFITVILFLFCTPDLDTVFALNAPQPCVQIYALALGKEGSVVMTIIAVIGLIMVRSILLGNKMKHLLTGSSQNTTITILAASRLVFAVARDGVLPLSGWIGQVDSNGQPKNAVTVIYIFGAMVQCTILPSQVAFTSLVSASIIPTVAAYALIPLLRLTMTPNHFQSSHFHLGRFAKPFYVCAVLINGIIAAVCIALHNTLLWLLIHLHCSRP
jgi:amino acid transporter